MRRSIEIAEVPLMHRAVSCTLSKAIAIRTHWLECFDACKARSEGATCSRVVRHIRELAMGRSPEPAHLRSVDKPIQVRLQALAAPDPDTWTVVVTTADRAGTGNLPCRETKLPCKDPYDELSDGDRCQFGRSRDSPRNIERQPALLTQPPAEMRLGSLEEVP